MKKQNVFFKKQNVFLERNTKMCSVVNNQHSCFEESTPFFALRCGFFHRRWIYCFNCFHCTWGSLSFNEIRRLLSWNFYPLDYFFGTIVCYHIQMHGFFCLSFYCRWFRQSPHLLDEPYQTERWFIQLIKRSLQKRSGWIRRMFNIQLTRSMFSIQMMFLVLTQMCCYFDDSNFIKYSMPYIFNLRQFRNSK